MYLVRPKPLLHFMLKKNVAHTTPLGVKMQNMTSEIHQQTDYVPNW